MVMVKLTGLPVQLPSVGVTVMVATSWVVTAALVKLMFPAPEAARPMAVLEFVQLRVAPVLPLRFTLTTCPPQAVALAGVLAVGEGLTVMVKVWAGPVQPFSEGVTVMVAVWVVATLALVKLMLPLPLGPRPMAGLLLVQA